MHPYASPLLSSFSLTYPLWRRSTRRSLRFNVSWHSRGSPLVVPLMGFKLHTFTRLEILFLQMLRECYCIRPYYLYLQIHAGTEYDDHTKQAGRCDLNVAAPTPGSKEEAS